MSAEYFVIQNDFKPFTFLKKMRRAWAKFLFSFLLPQKLIRRTEVSISSKPMLCEVANTNFKKSKNSLAILHNGWGLTKFKKYQMKKIEKIFFKFCLSPC